MTVMRIDRSGEGFYEYMGPIFGSRSIEKDTRDRFYDDEGKVWYLIPEHGAASVLGDTIKNFWAATPEAALTLLKELTAEYVYLNGVVPNKHEKGFRQMGFRCAGYRKNFLEVHYHAKD